MTPLFWRWSAHGQWHPVVGAHPLARITFQTAITAPGPPIQTETPTYEHNGHHCLHTRATLFGPSSFLCPSLPLCCNLVINLNSFIRRILSRCSHINGTSMTAGQGLAVFVVKDSMCFKWLFVYLELLYAILPAALSHLQDWLCMLLISQSEPWITDTPD